MKPTTPLDHRIADLARDLPIYQPSSVDARRIQLAILAAARVPEPAPRRWGWWLAGGTAALAVAAAVAMIVWPSHDAPTVASHGRHVEVALSSRHIVRISDDEMQAVALLGDIHVITGDAEVSASTGSFVMVAAHDHLRSLRVLQGTAELTTATQTLLLAAGESWEPQIARVELISPEVKTATPPPSTTHPSATRITPHAITTSPHAVGPATAKRPIEQLFEQGWSALSAGNATDAAATFERAALAAPGDPLAEDAWFWHASALARAKSGSAVDGFETFLSRYPHSPRAGEASAMLGWLVVDSHPDRAAQLFHAAEADRVAAVRASAAKGLANLAARH